MVDFVTATELLKAHHSIERPGSNVPTGQFFLKSMNGKQYLFQRVYLAVTDELVESPAIFEWDDIIAAGSVRIGPSGSRCHPLRRIICCAHRIGD
jgi:hypothetical protein